MRNDSHAVRILCSRPGCCFLYSLCCVGCPSCITPSLLSFSGWVQLLTTHRKPFQIQVSFFDYVVVVVYIYFQTVTTYSTGSNSVGLTLGERNVYYNSLYGGLRPGGLFRPFNTMKLHKRGRHYTSSSIVLRRTIFQLKVYLREIL